MHKRVLTGIIGSITLISLFAACSGQEKSPDAQQIDLQPYFSLSHYFNEEIGRLQSDSAEVFKTVEINGSTESKTILIRNWQDELAPFTEADINKSAWVNSYTVDSASTFLQYTAKESGLKTRQIRIEHAANGSVKAITIENQVSNWIYTAKEKLRYYPDSCYEIIKEQDIRIVGHNQYRIRGEWNPTDQQ